MGTVNSLACHPTTEGLMASTGGMCGWVGSECGWVWVRMYMCMYGVERKIMVGVAGDMERWLEFSPDQCVCGKGGGGGRPYL